MASGDSTFDRLLRHSIRGLCMVAADPEVDQLARRRATDELRGLVLRGRVPADLVDEVARAMESGCGRVLLPVPRPIAARRTSSGGE